MKTILITGASSGIGQRTAIEFAKRGYNLVITYNKNKTNIKETERNCKEAGAGQVYVTKLDLCENKSIDNLFLFA